MTKKVGVIASSALVGVFAASAASAQTLGEIAGDFSDQLANVSTVLEVGAFILGVFVAISGFMKFKAYNANPNDPSNSPGKAATLLLVGAGLVALPATLGSGVSTIFGEGGTTTNTESGFNGSIE